MIWHILHSEIVDRIINHVGKLTVPTVFECDHVEAGGTFSRLAGLRSARDVVRKAAYESKQIPSVLIVGISDRREIAAKVTVSEDAPLAALLEWPGAAYLQYGFSVETLCATASGVAKGVAVPLPSGIQVVTRADLLRASSNVRHWLEGRFRNERGALNDFYAEARGEIQLVREHLEPRSSISKEHQEMLDRLFGLCANSPYVSNTSGLGGVRFAVDRFEAAWKALEDTRARYLSQLGEADSRIRMRFAAQVCSALEQVTAALSLAIAETNRFDKEVKNSTGGINGV